MRKLVEVYWGTSGCVVLISIVSLLLSSACIQQPSGFNPTDAYDYPIKPGTEEWKAFTTHDEMLKACQIPENILKNMSTAGLVETVLNYPLYGDIRAYDSLQMGFDHVSARFNGLKELLNRKDAGTALIARYHTMDPAAIDEGWTILQKGRHVTSIQDIEILLAQDAILANLAEKQCNDLVKEAITKIQAKQGHIEIYGDYGQESTAWVIALVLRRVNYEPFIQKIEEDITLQTFLSKGSFAGDSTLNEILSLAEQFLSEK